MKPKYLGDSVYIKETGSGDLVIYTDNGDTAPDDLEHDIYLDDSVAKELVTYVTKWLEGAD